MGPCRRGQGSPPVELVHSSRKATGTPAHGTGRRLHKVLCCGLLLRPAPPSLYVLRAQHWQAGALRPLHARPAAVRPLLVSVASCRDGGAHHNDLQASRLHVQGRASRRWSACAGGRPSALPGPGGLLGPLGRARDPGAGRRRLYQRLKRLLPRYFCSHGYHRGGGGTRWHEEGGQQQPPIIPPVQKQCIAMHVGMGVGAEPWQLLIGSQGKEGGGQLESVGGTPPGGSPRRGARSPWAPPWSPRACPASAPGLPRPPLPSPSAARWCTCAHRAVPQGGGGQGQRAGCSLMSLNRQAVIGHRSQQPPPPPAARRLTRWLSCTGSCTGTWDRAPARQHQQAGRRAGVSRHCWSYAPVPLATTLLR